MEISLKASPPLKGEVCAQYIRCGKPNCRCRQGNPHGPYYYRIWRDGSRVRKIYVKQADLENVRQACAAYKLLAEQLRGQRLARTRITRQIKRAWRTTQALQAATLRLGIDSAG